MATSGSNGIQEEGTAKSAQQLWTPENTKLMLQLYLARKEKFRDPKWKKKVLWKEICKEMENAGCSDMSDDILDRKMRNMKKTYRTIKENNNKTGRGRVSWEYFTTMEDIFCDDKTINIGPSISSFCMQEGSVVDESLVVEDIYPLQDSTNLSCFIFDEESVSSSIQQKEKKACVAKESYHQRKKIIEMEQQRTEAIGILTNKIDEANKIQKDRNDLLKHFLEKFG